MVQKQVSPDFLRVRPEKKSNLKNGLQLCRHIKRMLGLPLLPRGVLSGNRRNFRHPTASGRQPRTVLCVQSPEWPGVIVGVKATVLLASEMSM